MTSYVFSFRPTDFGAERVTIKVTTIKGERDTFHGIDEYAGENLIRKALYSLEDKPDCQFDVTITPYDEYDGHRRYELPVAIGILAATGKEKLPNLGDYIIAGQLDCGECEGFYEEVTCASFAKISGKGCILGGVSAVYAANAVRGVSVFQARNIYDAIKLLRECNTFDILSATLAPEMIRERENSVWNDYTLFENERRGIEIMAGGGHPGFLCCDYRSQASYCLSELLPDFTEEGFAEVSELRSNRGYSPSRVHIVRDVSYSSENNIYGYARPHIGFTCGDASIAHKGVLSLLDFQEQREDVIDGVCDAFKNKYVSVKANNGRVRKFRSDFLLLFGANSNFLDTSYYSLAYVRDHVRGMSDKMLQTATVQMKTKGTRIENQCEPLEVVRARVEDARNRQMIRQGCLNDEAPIEKIRKSMGPDDATTDELVNFAMSTIESANLKGRSIYPVIRMARTIADLDGREFVNKDDIAEASKYRVLDDKNF